MNACDYTQKKLLEKGHALQRKCERISLPNEDGSTFSRDSAIHSLRANPPTRPKTAFVMLTAPIHAVPSSSSCSPQEKLPASTKLRTVDSIDSIVLPRLLSGLAVRIRGKTILLKTTMSIIQNFVAKMLTYQSSIIL